MLSPDAIVEEFGEEWTRSDLLHVMPKPQVVANGPLVELTSIGVHEKHQRQGYASRALRMLTTLCDENAMTIELIARPLESDLLPGCPATLSTEQLVDWHKGHGFVETNAAGDDTREMIRAPRMSSPRGVSIDSISRVIDSESLSAATGKSGRWSYRNYCLEAAAAVDHRKPASHTVPAKLEYWMDVAPAPFAESRDAPRFQSREAIG
jgi:GNAT superfamily N-acetyltransferase